MEAPRPYPMETLAGLTKPATQLSAEQESTEETWPSKPYLGIYFNDAVNLTNVPYEKLKGNIPPEALEKFQIYTPEMLNEQLLNAKPKDIEEWWKQKDPTTDKFPHRWKAVLAAYFKVKGLKATQTAVLEHCVPPTNCYSLAIEAKDEQGRPYYFRILTYQSTTGPIGCNLNIKTPGMAAITVAETNLHSEDPITKTSLVLIPYPLADLLPPKVLAKDFWKGTNQSNISKKSPEWPGMYKVPEPVFLRALKEAVKSPRQRAIDNVNKARNRLENIILRAAGLPYSE